MNSILSLHLTSCFVEVNNWIEENSKPHLRASFYPSLGCSKKQWSYWSKCPTKLSIPAPGVYDNSDVHQPYYLQIHLLSMFPQALCESSVMNEWEEVLVQQVSHSRLSKDYHTCYLAKSSLQCFQNYSFVPPLKNYIALVTLPSRQENL